MSVLAFAPLSRTLPYWPKELFGEADGWLDEVGITDFAVSGDDDLGRCTGTVAWLREIELRLPGLDTVSVVFLSTGGFTQVDFAVDLYPDFRLTLVNLKAALRLRSGFLRPVHQDADGRWVPTLGPDGAPAPAEFEVSGVNVTVSAEGAVTLAGAPALSLPPLAFGDTGIVLEMSDIGLYLSDDQPPPAGADAGFKGLTIGSAVLHLSGGLGVQHAPDTVSFTELLIGSSGFSGRIKGAWSAHYDVASGTFVGSGGGTLFGLEFGLASLDFTFRQNVPTDATLSGAIKLPFFEQPINVDISVGGDGGMSLALSAVQPPGVTAASGLISFEKSGVLRMEVDALELALEHGVFVAKLSGRVTPLAGGINWPSFDVRELSIDSSGDVHLEGGWMPLPKAYSIDFHGAKLEITKFGMGRTDDGGKYIGMSGKVELVKGLPGGASVDGLRVAWYDNGDVRLSFDGIGVSFKTPAVEFDGKLSYTHSGGTHEFKGDLSLSIPAANDLTLIGKAVFGRDAAGTKYFAIYLEGDFGVGIPLWATGLSLYGVAGLLAINYAPDKPGDMLWYSIDKSKSWFHKPDVGVIDIVKKWRPEPGAFALGAGVAIGTQSDNGYAFNGKFLLLMLCPGPVLMIDGGVRVLGKRDDTSEPPYHGLIVLDNRAGCFLVGLDVRWKSDKSQGALADISGSMEAFFNYHDPREWRLSLGKQEPVAQRIQARIAKVFTANAYFLLDAHHLALGAWIGQVRHEKWGPVKADMEAWLAADASISFKPPQYHVDIHLHGYLKVQVFRLTLGLGLDALLLADVFKPFHILGTLDIKIETRIKTFDIQMRLEWGPHADVPDLHAPELLPVLNWGIAHPKSSIEWALSGPAALPARPVVPMDCRPYVTFGYPVHDAIGVGVNPSPDPGWTTIGDPARGEGSARVRYSLTKIELYRDGQLFAACPPPSPSIGKIFGSWAPSVPGTSGGQNKLLLGSMNPLDFADDTDSWNPWLSSNLPGYPCPPDTPLETVCADFQGLEVGEQLYGAWWPPQNLDFRFDWSDAGPHPIVAVSPAVAGADRGLSFPAATPRKQYRAYVSNFADDGVSLVDLTTRTVIATIPTGLRPRQVVLAPDGKHAYVCNQDDRTFVTIDTATNQRVGAPLTVVRSPVSIALTRDGALAFVPSGVESYVTIIDVLNRGEIAMRIPFVANQAVLSPDDRKLYVMHGPAGAISIFAADSIRSWRLIKTLPAVGGPAAMVFHPSAPRAWISFPSRGTVRLFDTDRDELTALETPTGAFVRDLAVSPDGGRLYAGNLHGDTVSVLDTATLAVLATIAIPSPAGLRVTPDGAALLVANYFTDTISVIDTFQNRPSAQGIAAGHGSNSFAVLEPPPQMVYRALVTGQVGNAVSVLDLQARNAVATIAVGRTPLSIALTPDGKRAYVTNQDDKTVTVIDTVTNATVGAPIPVGTSPTWITMAPDGSRAFVMSGVEPMMSVLDLALARVTATVALPGAGSSICLSADGRKGYALCGPAKAVAVFTPSSLTVTTAFDAPGGPQFMAMHPSLPRAFVSFPSEGAVWEFDTDADQFIGTVVNAGAWAQSLCFSPDGARLYVCNLHGNTISVIETATNRVVATIGVSGPKSPVFTGDGSLLVVASYTGSSVVTIDPATNQLVGSPIPCASFPSALVLRGTAKPERPSPLVPVEVTIDVPRGSSSVEVTWAGTAPLRGMATKPLTQTREVVAAAGATLKLDAATLGDPALASQGIDQIRLRSDAAWTLIRVCVTTLPFAGGLAEQGRLKAAFNQQVALWQHPPALLDPGRDYTVRVDWSAEVQGMGELNGWSESFTNHTLLEFRTAWPPALGAVSDPRVPPSKDRPAATGLEDLSLYVRRTIPVTQTAKDQVPELTKPVFRGYDVGVEFNESYVDQMYRMAGRDLDLLLFDRNNQPVRDSRGPLIIVEDAWANAPQLVLTDTQARWIEMFNAATCELQVIDPTVIPTSKVLRAPGAHVLAADTVYEARLVPQLTRQFSSAAVGWTSEASAGGAYIWDLAGGGEWTDYRVSVLVTLNTWDPIGILFRYTSGRYYEFTIDPAAKRRRLTLNGALPPLAEDFYVYHPGVDDPHRIHIEALGSQILVSQNGTVVFALTDATWPPGPAVPTGTVLVAKGTVLPTGTVGLRQPAGPTVFQDLGVSDLRAGAPVAYRFHFTTSEFANFYHQIHSFQDEVWPKDMTPPLDLSAAVPSSPGGVLASATAGQPVTDAEVRAYDRLASLVSGAASAQDPPRVDVTCLAHGGAILGWLLRSPEPIDFTRTELTLSAARRTLARAQPPGAVKITEADFGDLESVTVLAREAIDLSGYGIHYRQMPSALADELGSQSLWKGGREVAGDQTWRDYRASVVCRASQPGGIGLQFRYVDAQNHYTFTYDCVSGSQRIVKTVDGVATVLESAPGDPAPGVPDAPPVRLTVSVRGSHIAGYRAGRKVVETSDIEFPAGGAGVFSAGNSSAQFESFEVHRLPNELYALLQGQGSTAAITDWQHATDGSGLRLWAAGNSSWTDVILRARLRRVQDGTTGLLLRYQDSNNHYRLLFTDTDRRLERVVQGVPTTLWSAPGPLPVDQVCEIAVSVMGQVLSVFQDSVLACEVADGSFASGSLGVCASPDADLACSQAVVFPPELAFSGWTLRDEFRAPSADRWSVVDAGDQGGPSNWQVTNGRLTQTSAIQDSSADPIRRRGTVALLNGSGSTGIRLVTRLRSPQPGAIGAVFGYQDSDNFHRFSMDASAGYRRLVRCASGVMTVLWADSVTLAPGPDHVLTLDVMDDYVTAWLDGEQVFHIALSEDVNGSVGLYCCGNSGASFGDFRVGVPAWIPYYTFGPEQPLSAGNRVKIVSAKGMAAPNRRTSLRLGADLDDPVFARLPVNGVHLRIVAPDQTVQHGRECIPEAEFARLPFQALREADGTGIFLAPASIAGGSTMRLSLQYRRDNGVVGFSEAGESGDELVFIDLPTPR